MTDLNCLFLVPEGERMPLVQRLRLRYDPLAELIPPHVTVVFPFEAALRTFAFRALLEEQRSALPIAFELEKPEVKEDCLFFPIGAGRQAVLSLSKGLYSALPSSLRLEVSHVPHLTFGRLKPGQRVEALLREAEQALPLKGLCRRLILEAIGKDGHSLPELEVRCD